MRSTNYLAIQASMGNWEYYVTTMRADDLVEYVKFAEEVFPNPALDEIIQRDLARRSTEISEFLTSNQERFFGSLIIAVYGGCPKFSRVEIESIGLLGVSNSTVGILQFDGKEDYYVLDGQHRLAAIKEAISKDNKAIQNDQISIILISHSKDSEGIQRARRLFTNLNRYAVKTSKSDNIAIDEDDGLSIITRRLVREHNYFKQAVKIATIQPDGSKALVKGEALKKGDRMFLATLPTIYECNKNLLEGSFPKLNTKGHTRPNEETLLEAYHELEKRWNHLIEKVNAFTPQNGFERDSSIGGKVIHRPIGLKSFKIAAGHVFQDSSNSIETLLDTANQYEDLSSYPWVGLPWNPKSKRMEAGKARIKIASHVYEAISGLPIDLAELNNELSSLGASELDI